MADSAPQPAAKLFRSWRDIAVEITKAKDPRRLIELSEELNQALGEQDAELPGDNKSD